MTTRKHRASDGLASLASRQYVSERGLAQVLKDVKENPELLEHSSRSSIKRARKRVLDCGSIYGSLVRRMTIPYEDDPSVGLEFAYIDPIAMLAHAVLNCAQFGNLFLSCHQSKPSSHDQPWNIILYSDEVTIGDPLSAAAKARKVQALYWSIKELGPEALSCDTTWFYLTVIRSQAIAHIGGLSVLASAMMNTFFAGDADVRLGLKLRDQLVFLDLGCIVQDYDAFKHMTESKGASGILICLICQNCVAFKRSDIHSSSAYLVSSFELDISKFHRHDSNSLADAFREQSHTMSMFFVVIVSKLSLDAYAIICSHI
jgi:hypothetical protein